MRFNPTAEQNRIEQALRVCRANAFAGSDEEQDANLAEIHRLKKEAAPFWNAERDAREDNSAMSATWGF